MNFLLVAVGVVVFFITVSVVLWFGRVRKVNGIKKGIIRRRLEGLLK